MKQNLPLPLAFLILAASTLTACAETCRASYYRLAGRTANGERVSGLTAAHRTFALGTRVSVCRGSRCVTVRINDRGPSIRTGNCLDVSYGAAVALEMLKSGMAIVSFRRVAETGGGGRALPKVSKRPVAQQH